ncbi:ABC transporter permease, partial [Rhodococcus chondri]
MFPVALLTILGLIPAFREAGANLGGRRVIALYVPVVVLLAMIVAGIQTMPAVLSAYRERGILRRLSVTPARPATLLMAQIAVHAVAVAVSVLFALLVGRFVFEVPLPAQPGGYALAVLFTLAAALSLGAAISAVSATTR